MNQNETNHLLGESAAMYRKSPRRLFTYTFLM